MHRNEFACNQREMAAKSMLNKKALHAGEHGDEAAAVEVEGLLQEQLHT